jgi:predicted unusual protein kinase regulating ubiquinone biosynthesis (AarF/ABC1/UbiB family)
MARRFDALGFRPLSGETADLQRFAALFVELFQGDLTADLVDVDPHEQVAKALQLVRAHPLVQVPQDFVLLGRVLATLAGLMLHYKPDLNLFRTLMPYLTAHLQDLAQAS